MTSPERLARRAAAGAAVLSSLVSATALADASGLYVGATGGLTASSYGQQPLNEAVAASAASADYSLKVESASLRTSAPVAAALVGYTFTPYFGIEASYLYLNMQRYRVIAGETFEEEESAPATPLNLRLNLISRGPTLALTGGLPLTNNWQLDGRVGAYEGSMRTNYWSEAGTYRTSGSQSESSTSLMLNAGTSYSFAGHWMVRLEYVYLNHLSEKVLGQSFNTGLVMAGASYWF